MEEPTRMALGTQALTLLRARPEGLSEDLLYEILNFNTVFEMKRPGLPSRSVGRSRREKMEHALASLLRRKLVEFLGDGRWRARA